MRPPEAKNLRWKDITKAKDKDDTDIFVLFVQSKGKTRKLIAAKNVGDYAALWPCEHRQTCRPRVDGHWQLGGHAHRNGRRERQTRSDGKGRQSIKAKQPVKPSCSKRERGFGNKRPARKRRNRDCAFNQPCDIANAPLVRLNW
jgi:hypothetical protein